MVATAVVPLAGTEAASAAPAYQSINTFISSFDGTPIHVEFFPANGLTVGRRAPTVLDASAWSLPAYPSWLGTLGSIGIGNLSVDADLIGPATLTANGFNVVTWDPRGTYLSGGQVTVDDPAIEGRDVTAIIDWLAALPAAELKGPDDPVVGMTGVSYGGGIQLSAAIDDHRLDAIEPNMSWDSLNDSLDPNNVVKAGWGTILCLIGGVVGYRFSAELTKQCGTNVTDVNTSDEIAAMEDWSPGAAVSQITTPTLLLAGTVDTLFPLAGDVRTYDLLRAAGTPVKMVWYCGGHGICNLPPGDSSHVVDVQLAFLDKYLMHEDISTGPGFEYQDQTGVWQSAASYPPQPSGSASASGGGYLWLNPLDTSGSLGIEATPAFNAIDIGIPPSSQSVELVSAPKLTLSYWGVATQSTAPMFAQLVDRTTGTVLDNQATPFLLTLDGTVHTLTVSMNTLAWQLDPSSQVELQLTDGSDLYYHQTAIGLVDVTSATARFNYSVQS